MNVLEGSPEACGGLGSVVVAGPGWVGETWPVFSLAHSTPLWAEVSRFLPGEVGSGNVFTVMFVYVVLQADSDQSFQGRGAEVEQGGEAMVGCVLQVRKGHQRDGVPVVTWAAMVPGGH